MEMQNDRDNAKKSKLVSNAWINWFRFLLFVGSATLAYYGLMAICYFWGKLEIDASIETHKFLFSQLVILPWFFMECTLIWLAFVCFAVWRTKGFSSLWRGLSVLILSLVLISGILSGLFVGPLGMLLGLIPEKTSLAENMFVGTCIGLLITSGLGIIAGVGCLIYYETNKNKPVQS